jgi:hypothetical protein
MAFDPVGAAKSLIDKYYQTALESLEKKYKILPADQEMKRIFEESVQYQAILNNQLARVKESLNDSELKVVNEHAELMKFSYELEAGVIQAAQKDRNTLGIPALFETDSPTEFPGSSNPQSALPVAQNPERLAQPAQQPQPAQQQIQEVVAPQQNSVSHSPQDIKEGH